MTNDPNQADTGPAEHPPGPGPGQAEHPPASHEGHPNFRDAAIIAEFETGEREPTVRLAWRHALLRIVRMSFGISMLGVGGLMLVLPGPGLLVIAIGLGTLARDVAWADRLLQKVLVRLPSNEQGKLPRSTIVTMVLLGLAGVSFSLAYYLGDWSLFFWRK